MHQLTVLVFQVSQAASIAAGYAPGWGLAVLRAMQAGAKRRYDRGDIDVIPNDDEDSKVLAVLGDEAASNLLALSYRRAKNVADFDKHAKRRLAEKLAALAALQQRRDSRCAQLAALTSRAEEKWRRLYLQRERNAEQHRRDAIRDKLASRRYACPARSTQRRLLTSCPRAARTSGAVMWPPQSTPRRWATSPRPHSCHRRTSWL